METKKEQKEDTFGWLQPFLDGFLGTVQNFIKGAVDSVYEATENFAQSFMRKAFILSIAILGVFFLFKGFAEMLSMVYGKDGLGEIIVGGFTLLLWAAVYVFHKSK